MSREIPLNNGLVAIVDDEDFEWLSQWRWSAKDGRYACRRPGTIRKHIRMHREIMRPAPYEEVDHINGNGLDNRRCNLRICVRAENARNIRARGAVPYKGVCARGRDFQARLRVAGHRFESEMFATPEEAARAYDELARMFHGPFARLNFPRPGEEAA